MEQTAVVSLSRVTPQTLNPGSIESVVETEISDFAEAGPGLTQIALSLARTIDNPKAMNQQAAVAKVLTALLDKLRSASGHGSRVGLAVVRTTTEKGV